MYPINGSLVVRFSPELNLVAFSSVELPEKTEKVALNTIPCILTPVSVANLINSPSTEKRVFSKAEILNKIKQSCVNWIYSRFREVQEDLTQHSEDGIAIVLEELNLEISRQLLTVDSIFKFQFSEIDKEILLISRDIKDHLYLFNEEEKCLPELEIFLVLEAVDLIFQNKENVKALLNSKRIRLSEFSILEIEGNKFEVNTNFIDRIPGEVKCLIPRRTGDPLSLRVLLNKKDRLAVELERKSCRLREKKELETLQNGLEKFWAKWLNPVWLEMLKPDERDLRKYRIESLEQGYAVVAGFDIAGKEVLEELLRLTTEIQDATPKRSGHVFEFSKISEKLKAHLKKWNESRNLTKKEFFILEPLLNKYLKSSFRQIGSCLEIEILRKEISTQSWKDAPWDVRELSFKYLSPLEMDTVFALIDILFHIEDLQKALKESSSSKLSQFSRSSFFKGLSEKMSGKRDSLAECESVKTLKGLFLERYIANTTE